MCIDERKTHEQITADHLPNLATPYRKQHLKHERIETCAVLDSNWLQNPAGQVRALTNTNTV
jgi:hypothetical protein